MRKNNIQAFADQIIFIINYVIDELVKNPLLLKFISKNLSWGVYNETILKLYNKQEEAEDGLYSLFLKGIEENHIKIGRASCRERV